MEDSVKNLDSSAQAQDADKKAVPVENKAECDVPVPEEKKKRTAGNIVYDFGVFGSIAWLGVSIMSALTAHEAMHGSNKAFNWMRSANKAMASGLQKWLAGGIMKNAKPDTVEAVAKNTTMVFSLGMGGHTLMAPIKWLEDHRQSNAAKIDEILGTVPPDKDSIAREPKQSWKSVISGRMLSWASAFAVVLATPHKFTTKVNNYFGEKGANAWMKLRPKANPVAVRKWSDIVSFDLIFTALTATVTWAFSRFVAKRKMKEMDEIDEGLYQLNPIAPNPLGEEEPEPEKKSNFADKAQAARNNKDNELAATAFVDKIKRDDRAHSSAAAFIDKIQRDETAQHALS